MSWRDRKEAEKEFLIYKTRKGSCFSHMLFDLIAKADSINKKKLANAFPAYVDIYSEWYYSKSENEFFEELERRVLCGKRRISSDND